MQDSTLQFDIIAGVEDALTGGFHTLSFLGLGLQRVIAKEDSEARNELDLRKPFPRTHALTCGPRKEMLLSVRGKNLVFQSGLGPSGNGNESLGVPSHWLRSPVVGADVHSGNVEMDTSSWWKGNGT